MSNDSIVTPWLIYWANRFPSPAPSAFPPVMYPFPDGAAMAYRLIRGVAASPLCELGWKSLGVLELTALPSITANIGSLWSRRLTPCW